MAGSADADLCLCFAPEAQEESFSLVVEFGGDKLGQSLPESVMRVSEL